MEGADRLFKVLVIGDLGVGKSSIILRYVKRRFDGLYKASIGVDFALKTVEWDASTVVRLQLWDIAGQERYKKMCRVYYRGAMGALVVLDLTKSSTQEAAAEWKRDLDMKVSADGGAPVPAVLLANKCDLVGSDAASVASMDAFCRDNGFLGWFETSAKDNINIDEAGSFLVQQMMLCHGDGGGGGVSREERRRDVIKVGLRDHQGEGLSDSSCCWRL